MLATVVVGPMMRPGWVLLLDWVVGPRSNFADRIFAGDSLPAGPLFFGVAALLHHALGAAAGWVFPWLLLTLAGFGASRLVGDDTVSSPLSSTLASMTAATAFLWNPFVHERLYSGQLAVLAGYAVLPYLLAATLRTIRRNDSRHFLKTLGPGLIWAIAAAFSIHYAVLGGFVVLSVVVVEGVSTRRWRLRWFVTVCALVVLGTAAWLLPILDTAPQTGDQQTIQAFATRPDPNLGLAAGVALQTGFWRPSLGEPNSALGWWWPIVGGALSGAVVVGLVARSRGKKAADESEQRRLQKQCARSVAALGVIGWLLGQGGSGPTGALFRILTDVPTFRVMREAGKFVALVSLAWSVGLGSFVLLLTTRRTIPTPSQSKGGRFRALLAVAVAMPLAPIALTPGLAWGVDGRLAAVRYPRDWHAIRRELDLHRGGSVVALPFVGYFDPGFTNDRIVRSPVKAFFGDRALLSDDAQVAGLEPSKRSRKISAALTSASPASALDNIGIEWVIATSETEVPATFLPITVGTSWVLYRVGGLTDER